MPDREPLDPDNPADLDLLIEYAYLGAGIRSGVPVDHEAWHEHEDCDEAHCQLCIATEIFDRVHLLMEKREAQHAHPAKTSADGEDAPALDETFASVRHSGSGMHIEAHPLFPGDTVLVSDRFSDAT
jgi:hypothetical protein